MDECAQIEIDEVQRQLNTAMAQEFREYGPFGKSAYVHAAYERWNEWVDDECALEASPYRGGTVYPLEYGDCVLNLMVSETQLVREDTLSVPH